MKVFLVKELANKYIKGLRSKNKTIGLVPTMGALHQGHLSLIQTAKQQNNVVVVSIFVNPTQFNNPKDLEKYPRTLTEDLEKLKAVGCDVVFTPNVDDMYKPNETAEVFNFAGLDKKMEGKFRDNHFNGVGTVVKKLFDVLMPHNAYFGEKDFQQLQIVKKLVTLTKQPVNIVGCSIYREVDGLAMSSRNIRLSKIKRSVAPFIYQIISKASKKTITHTPQEITNWVTNQFKNHPHLILEYFNIADEDSLKEATVFDKNKKYRAFIAVFAGEIRLIDNIALPIIN